MDLKRLIDGFHSCCDFTHSFNEVLLILRLEIPFFFFHFSNCFARIQNLWVNVIKDYSNSNRVGKILVSVPNCEEALKNVINMTPVQQGAPGTLVTLRWTGGSPAGRVGRRSIGREAPR